MLEPTVKSFTAGNSQALRLTKADLKKLNADQNTRYEKTISPDGRSIIFTKAETNPELEKFIKQVYEEHGDLMKALADS